MSFFKFFLVVIGFYFFLFTTLENVQAIPSGQMLVPLQVQYNNEQYDPGGIPDIEEGRDLVFNGVVNPGERVTIEFEDGEAFEATADEAGNWEIVIITKGLVLGESVYTVRKYNYTSGKEEILGKYKINIVPELLSKTGEEENNTLPLVSYSFIILISIALFLSTIFGLYRSGDNIVGSDNMLLLSLIKYLLPLVLIILSLIVFENKDKFVITIIVLNFMTLSVNLAKYFFTKFLV